MSETPQEKVPDQSGEKQPFVYTENDFPPMYRDLLKGFSLRDDTPRHEFPSKDDKIMNDRGDPLAQDFE